MNITELDFCYLTQKEELVSLLNRIQNIPSVANQYIACQCLLDYINVCFIQEYLHFELRDDWILIHIIDAYHNSDVDKDDDLYNTMLDINVLYEEIAELGADEFDVEYLLRKIDFIYGILQKSYDIDFKSGTEICKSFWEDISLLEQ